MDKFRGFEGLMNVIVFPPSEESWCHDANFVGRNPDFYITLLSKDGVRRVILRQCSKHGVIHVFGSEQGF